MKKLNVLHIIANPKPEQEANSKQLADIFFNTLLEKDENVEIEEVDLYESSPPHYSYDVYRYFWYPVFNKDYKPSKEEEKAATYALEQIKLFNYADILVITAPMWNFSVPSALKAWMDQTLSPGKVFKIGPEGVEPLHHIKKVILLTSSGGTYSNSDAREHLFGQIKAAFGFVKIDKFECAWVDGQNTFFFKDSEDRKEKAFLQAKELAANL